MTVAGELVDILTVSQTLKNSKNLQAIGGNKTLIELTSLTFTSQNIESYARIVKEKSIRRASISAGYQIQVMAYDESKDYQDIQKEANDILNNIPSITKDTLVTMTDFYEDYCESMNDLESGIPLGYKSWLQILDNNCDGIQPGTVTRLSAYSNHGKTRLAIWVMVNLLKQWVSCGFFSTEVTKRHFFPILSATFQKVNDKDIKHGRVAPNMDLISKLPVSFYQDKRNLDDIIAMAKKHKFQVVFIDFAQNIDAGYRNDIYVNMTEYAIRIQQFAIENNVAVFDLSQINVEWAKWGSSKVIPSKGSGSLVESADICLFMERTVFDDNATIIKLDLRKNKYGNLASAELSVDYKRSHYIETKL